VVLAMVVGYKRGVCSALCRALCLVLLDASVVMMVVRL
jgi:hypothetical protein